MQLGTQLTPIVLGIGNIKCASVITPPIIDHVRQRPEQPPYKGLPVRASSGVDLRLILRSTRLSLISMRESMQGGAIRCTV